MSFITRAWNKIKSLFHNIPDELRDVIKDSLEITRRIKALLESPEADIVTAIIPGYWDDQKRQQAIEILATIIPQLMRIEDCKGDMKCLFVHLLSVLRERAKKDQHATLFALASLFVQAWDNGRYKESQYDFYVQLAYTAEK